jgi:phage-related protein
MTRTTLAEGEKPLHWIGSSKKDLDDLPEEVRYHMGIALGIAQFGKKSQYAKPWKGDGPGIFEVVTDYRSDTFRAVYTVRFGDVVYVLHVFQKKSKRGIKTPREHQDLVAQRLQAARMDYEVRYANRKKD